MPLSKHHHISKQCNPCIRFISWYFSKQRFIHISKNKKEHTISRADKLILCASNSEHTKALRWDHQTRMSILKIVYRCVFSFGCCRSRFKKINYKRLKMLRLILIFISRKRHTNENIIFLLVKERTSRIQSKFLVKIYHSEKYMQPNALKTSSSVLVILYTVNMLLMTHKHSFIWCQAWRVSHLQRFHQSVMNCRMKSSEDANPHRKQLVFFKNKLVPKSFYQITKSKR